MNDIQIKQSIFINYELLKRTVPVIELIILDFTYIQYKWKLDYSK